MSAEELQIIERIAAANEKIAATLDRLEQRIGKLEMDQRKVLNAIFDLVGDNNDLLRGNRAAEMELERRRAKHAEVVRKSRKRVTSQNSVTSQRKEEKEKASPYNPYKEKDEEKKDTHTSRAREGIPSVEEVAEECAATGSDIDPQYFVNYYLSHPDAKLGDWKSMLANWTKNPIKSGRVEPEKAPRKKLSDKEWLKQIEEAVRKEREDGQKEC